MNKRCIVNFAKNGDFPNLWYLRGQERLRRSLQDVGWDGDFLAYNDELQVDALPHRIMPYAFKYAALMKSVKAGYQTLLWLDASVFAIKPLDPFFDYIEKNGYAFFSAGFNCAQWTNDNALSVMRLSRDEAEKIPMYMALCMGFNIQHPRTYQFLDQLAYYATNTTAFRGNWTNDYKTESNDARCLGHRHDQSVGSILAAKYGMELPGSDVNFLAYYNNGLYNYGGQNDMTGIQDSVCLLAQGMMS